MPYGSCHKGGGPPHELYVFYFFLHKEVTSMAQVCNAALAAWKRRCAAWLASGKLARPDITFSDFLAERDKCMDRSYTSGYLLFQIGFFCNNNRMDDPTSKELAHATMLITDRQGRVLTCLLHRFAGSPKNVEKPGRSGAAVIGQHVVRDSPQQLADFIKEMPFSNRGTYRPVLSGRELALVATDVAKHIASTHAVSNLIALRDLIVDALVFSGKQHPGTTMDNTQRACWFHSLQLAFDLVAFKIIRLEDDGASCPLAIGSRAGLSHVRAFEDKTASLLTLASLNGRAPSIIQTALCEFDKYCRWYNGVDPVRLRDSNTGPHAFRVWQDSLESRKQSEKEDRVTAERRARKRKQAARE